jgi:hydroxylamine reductase (hybrid-cluster protein)
MEKMFCYQCQETSKNEGCTIIGVCGKTADVANSFHHANKVKNQPQPKD